jgi:hypothetical protein
VLFEQAIHVFTPISQSPQVLLGVTACSKRIVQLLTFQLHLVVEPTDGSLDLVDQDLIHSAFSFYAKGNGDCARTSIVPRRLVLV